MFKIEELPGMESATGASASGPQPDVQGPREAARRQVALLSGTALTASLAALGVGGMMMLPGQVLAACNGVDVIACGDGPGGVAEGGVVTDDKEITIVPGGTVTTGILYGNAGNTASFTVFVQGPSDTQPGGTATGPAQAFNLVTMTGNINFNTDAGTSITGVTGDGMRLRTTTGDITLNLGGNVTAGSNDSEAIDAQSSAGGTATANIRGGTYTGDDNEVITLGSAGGAVAVNVENGAILENAGRHGLWVINSDTADIWFDGIIRNVDANGIQVGQSGVPDTADNVEINVGGNASIVGGTNGIYVDADGAVRFFNGGHVEGAGGAGAIITADGSIFGGNFSYESIVGATNGLVLSGDVVAYRNNGLIAGLTGHGLIIENVAGVGTVQGTFPDEYTWTPPGTTVVLANNGYWDDQQVEHMGGVILGAQDGLRIRDVSNGDVVIANDGYLIDDAGDVNNGRFSDGGLIAGFDSGVDVRNVDSGSLFIWNGNTRQSVNDLSDDALDDAVYAALSGVLTADDQLPGGYTAGIWSWDDHAVRVRNVDGLVDVSNASGIIASLSANAIDVSNVGGNDIADGTNSFSLFNGVGLADNPSGLIWGGQNGVDLWNINGRVNVDNADGTIFGVQGGVDVRNFTGDQVWTGIQQGGLIQGLYGDAVRVSDVAGGVFVDNNGGSIFGGDRAIYYRDVDGEAGVNNAGNIIGDGSWMQPVIRFRNIENGDERASWVDNHPSGIIASRNLPHVTTKWTAPGITELPGWDVDRQAVSDDVNGLVDYVLHGGTLDTAALTPYQAAAWDWALRSTDGGTTYINNESLIAGRLRLDADSGIGGNNLDNHGAWFVAGWNRFSDQQGDSGIHNFGLVQSAFDPMSGEWASIAADHLNNNEGGVFSMIDGGTGDRTTLRGFYHGNDGRLGVDVDLVALDSDLLRLRDGDNEGNTGLIVRLVDEGGVYGSRIQFANYDGTLANDAAFHVDGASDNFVEMGGAGFVEDGLLAWYVDHDTANERYDLVAGWGPGAVASPGVITGAQNAFYATLDHVPDHIYGGQFAPAGGGGADLVELAPDPVTGGSRIAAWLKGVGEVVERSTSVTLTPPGVTVDTSSTQGIAALLGGLDFTMDSNFRVGAFAGAVGSNLDYGLAGVGAVYGGGTGGIYGAYNDGALYVDLTGKVDMLGVTYEYAGNSVDATAVSYGMLGNAGYRFSAGPGFVEPTASVAAVNTQVSDVSGIDFLDATSLRAGAGVRVGTEVESEEFVTEIAVLGKLWNEFGGPNTTTVTSGGSTLTAVDHIDGLFGEVAGTVTLSNLEDTMSGFLKVGGTFGARQTSYDAQAGVRMAF